MKKRKRVDLARALAQDMVDEHGRPVPLGPSLSDLVRRDERPPYGYDRHDESEPSIIGKTADGRTLYGPPEGIEEPLEGEGEGEPEIVYLDAPPPGARPGRVHPD